MVSTNLLLLRLSLGLEAADLLLRQRRRVLLLLGRPEPELEVGHLPLQLHDPGALGHGGHLQQKIQRGRRRGDGRLRGGCSSLLNQLTADRSKFYRFSV